MGENPNGRTAGGRRGLARCRTRVSAPRGTHCPGFSDRKCHHCRDMHPLYSRERARHGYTASPSWRRFRQGIESRDGRFGCCMRDHDCGSGHRISHGRRPRHVLGRADAFCRIHNDLVPPAMDPFFGIGRRRSLEAQPCESVAAPGKAKGRICFPDSGQFNLSPFLSRIRPRGSGVALEFTAADPHQTACIARRRSASSSAPSVSFCSRSSAPRSRTGRSRARMASALS